MSLPPRLYKALLASLFGWIAGLFAAMPFQIVEAIRVTGSDSRLLVTELGLTLALWIVLTFALAFYWCGFFLFPIAWIVPAGWILRHRSLWISASTVFGIALIVVRGHVWTAFDHDGVSLITFWMWAVFSTTFFLVTSALYEKSLRDTRAVQE